MLSLTAAVLLTLSSQSGVDRLALSAAEVADESASADQDKQGQKIDTGRPSAPEKSPVDVWFEDGIRFKSRDGNWEGRIGGRFLTHYRTIFDRPFEAQTGTSIRNLPNTFFVRQARIETEGTLYQDWGYKVQVDFGTGLRNQASGTAASNVSGTLRDGFVEWKRYKAFQVRMGQFFEPLSQEDISSTRFIDFAERSPMNRLLPGREIGIQVAGSLLNNELLYAIMLCNGNALLNDQGRAVNDGNDQKEVAAMFRYLPMLNCADDWLKGLRLALAFSWGLADSASTDFDLISTELSVLWAASTGTPNFHGFRGRIVPQISWPIGPFCFRGEYLYRTDELIGSTVGGPDALRTRAWYGYVTYILTGENKKVEDRIVPTGDWGAFELAFRVSQVSAGNGFETGIFAPGADAEGMTSFTFGINWWVNRNVRLTLNVIREKYRDHLGFDRQNSSMLMGMIFRAQVDF